MNSEGTKSHTHMYPFSPKVPSNPGYHITLSRVPCSQAFLVIHFKYSSVCMSWTFLYEDETHLSIFHYIDNGNSS